MRILLVISAIVEAATGLVLLVSPSMLTTLLVGASLDTLAGLLMGRIAGAAIMALALACWLARSAVQDRAARGLIAAMLLYNAVAFATLGYAGFALCLEGGALWLGVVLHAGLTAWCIGCLWTGQSPRDRTG